MSSLALRAVAMAEIAKEDQDNGARKAWSTDEDAFIKTNYLKLSDAELADALGRTEISVRLRIKRDMGLPGRSKMPGVITAYQAALKLGLDIHKFSHWCRSGLVPTIAQDIVDVILLDEYTFTRWVINWRNWIYFDRETLPDLRLRALCERRAQRWGDEWWSTEQVAQYHGCGSKAVVHQIRRGKLPGVQRALGAHEKYTGRKWKVWYVLRSDAMATKALYFKKLTPAALDYVRRARADGDVWRVINKKMKLPAGHEALRNYSRQHGIK